ncbi:cyclase, partial [Escherichia coli]|nr:cyclase [Escherichia coli]
DTRITEDRPGEVIAWESTGGDVKTESRIEFKDAPGGRGTEVHAKVDYHPPLGPLGKIAAVVTQKGPELQARRDLKQFKMLMETGEIATT